MAITREKPGLPFAPKDTGEPINRFCLNSCIHTMTLYQIERKNKMKKTDSTLSTGSSMEII